MVGLVAAPNPTNSASLLGLSMAASVCNMAVFVIWLCLWYWALWESYVIYGTQNSHGFASVLYMSMPWIEVGLESSERIHCNTE